MILEETKGLYEFDIDLKQLQNAYETHLSDLNSKMKTIAK